MLNSVCITMLSLFVFKIKIWIKGAVSRDFLTMFFFIKQLFLAPLDTPTEGFWIFSNIRGVIRVCNWLPGVNSSPDGEKNSRDTFPLKMQSPFFLKNVEIFYLFSILRFFHSMFFPVNVFTFRCFVPVDVFLQSTFFPVTFSYYLTFFPYNVLSQSAFFPFDVMSHSAFFLSTFCPSTFFTVGVFYFDVLLVNWMHTTHMLAAHCMHACHSHACTYTAHLHHWHRHAACKRLHKHMLHAWMIPSCTLQTQAACT